MIGVALFTLWKNHLLEQIILTLIDKPHLIEMSTSLNLRIHHSSYQQVPLADPFLFCFQVLQNVLYFMIPIFSPLLSLKKNLINFLLERSRLWCVLFLNNKVLGVPLCFNSSKVWGGYEFILMVLSYFLKCYLGRDGSLVFHLQGFAFSLSINFNVFGNFFKYMIHVVPLHAKYSMYTLQSLNFFFLFCSLHNYIHNMSLDFFRMTTPTLVMV